MKVSDKLIKLVSYYECSSDLKKYLTAYICPAKIYTIGVGTTVYPNGLKVKEGDTCTVEQAVIYLKHDLCKIERYLNQFNLPLTQSQFDSLVSFAYNCGITALDGSTLLKKVKVDHNDVTISKEFYKWIYGGNGQGNGKDDDGDGLIDEPGEKLKLEGLINRRRSEAYLYFYNDLKF